MSKEHPSYRQHPVTQDIPLPGHYPCLTLQLNVTRYQATGVWRAILVVREPSEHIEVERASLEVPEGASDPSLTVWSMIDQSLANMVWMQNGAH